MVWTFSEIERDLENTAPPGTSVYGLGRIQHLLEILEHPENDFRCITVVGTNGKGSTLAYLDSLLLSHGFKTACHIKPHLEKVTERMRANGVDSTEDEFAEAMGRVADTVKSKWTREDKPTYFELIFAGFLIFAQTKGVDIALLETGLGGRLDAVNAVDADLVVMTSVSFDHTELLGDTLQKIAMEKVAVTRSGKWFLCAPNPEEVLSAVNGYASEIGVQTAINEKCSVTFDSEKRAFSIDTPWGKGDGIKSSLAATYQCVNLETALAAFGLIAKGVIQSIDLEPDFEKICEGISHARLPGRFENFEISGGKFRVILDGAHNPGGIESVTKELMEFVRGDATIILGMKESKDIYSVLPMILDCARYIIFTNVPDLKSHDIEDLHRWSYLYLSRAGKLSQVQLDTADSIKDALKLAVTEEEPPSTILVTGSLYLAGAARSLIRGKLIQNA